MYMPDTKLFIIQMITTSYVISHYWHITCIYLAKAKQLKDDLWIRYEQEKKLPFGENIGTLLLE